MHRSRWIQYRVMGHIFNFWKFQNQNQFHTAKIRFQDVAKEIVSTKNDLNLFPRINALDKVNEDNIHLLNEIGPSLKKSFNLAAYVNGSETLQQLVKLNVDLSKIEKDTDLASFVVRCDYKTDIEPFLLFLMNNGIAIDEVGHILTKNPYLLTVPMEDIQKRMDYFLFRKFSKKDVATILLKCPRVFNLNIQKIDQNLGDLVDEYRLNPDQIRHIVRKHPKVILLSAFQVKKCTFMFKEEMGLTAEETKSLILRYPVIWTKFPREKNGHQDMLRSFDYVHNTMNIPLEQIVRHPLILCRRVFLIKGRHLYLKSLDRAQYDPTKPLFVPLTAFFAIDDGEFCIRYAKTSVIDFNEFLKTL